MGSFTPGGPERLSEVTQVSWCRTRTCSIKPTGAARVGVPGGANQAELYEGRTVPFAGPLSAQRPPPGCKAGQAPVSCSPPR